MKINKCLLIVGFFGFIFQTTTLFAQNNALNFDGTNDAVVVFGGDASLNISGTALTIEAWIYPTGSLGSGTYEHTILSKEDDVPSANAGYFLRHGNGKFDFGFGETTYYWVIESPANIITLNQWHHIAGTYDGVNLKLYHNGVLVQTLAQTKPISGSTKELHLGRWTQQFQRYFQGSLDEVRIWNVTRSATDIANNYQLEVSNSTPGLVAYFKMNQGLPGGNNTGITSLTNDKGTGNGTFENFAKTGSTSNFVLGAPAPLPGPGGVAGARLWLDASDSDDDGNSGNNPADGTDITNWIDKSGTNTFNKVGTIVYDLNSINFNPAVIFNNTDLNTSQPSNRLDGNTSISYVDGFAVYKKQNGTSGGAVIGSTSPNSNYGAAIFGGESANDSWVGNGIWNTYSSFSNTGFAQGFGLVNWDVSLVSSPYAAARYNGLAQSVTAGSGGDYTQINFTPRIGGTNNSGSNPSAGWKHFQGEIAEVVLYPNSLSSADKGKVESYLAIKYGISLDPSVTNYVSSAGTVLWNNTTYWNDVFGIGKDDGSVLNQPQSNSINTGSGDGTGQSGKGNIVLSNASSLDNGDFLMIGHDNAALTEAALGVGLPASFNTSRRLTRTWWAQHTGDAGAVSLSINLGGLIVTGTVASSFRLLVDADSDGNLATGQPQVYAADSYTGNIVSFSNVVFPNNHAFALVTSATTPAGANENLWLEANSGLTVSGSNVTGWTDQSNHNVFTVTGTPTKVTNALNFNPVVAFNNTGAASALPANRLTGNTSVSTVAAFAVMRSTTNTSTLLGSSVTGPNFGPAYFGYRGDDNQSAGNGQNNRFKYFSNTQRTNFSIAYMDISTAPGTYSLNGTTGGLTAAGGPFTSIPLTPMIGGTNNNGNAAGFAPFNGEVAEVITFATAPTAQQRQNIESYLAVKYGIQKVGNYFRSDNTVIWDATANAAYTNDVFGIGKDAGTGLNQPASNSYNSGSGDGTGQSGKGNILIKDPSSLDNNDFLMIGHDNQPLTEYIGDLPSGLARARLQREWKVKRTGDVGNITLEFDFNGLPVSGGTTQLSNYILLVDNDGDGDFTTGTVQQIAPSSFGSPKLIFTGLTPAQLPDGAVFTFVTSPGFPLPLNLLSFQAGTNNCRSQVSWKTANEVNVNRFELQVSYDGQNWTTIHTIQATNGNSNVNNYSYTYDHSTRSGNKQLRLKMVDNDGKTTYSKIISVQCGRDNVFSIYPNPATDRLTVTGTKAGDQLRVFNLDGKLLTTLTASQGNTTVNLENFPAGTYLIQLRRNGLITEVGKVVKQ